VLQALKADTFFVIFGRKFLLQCDNLVQATHLLLFADVIFKMTAGECSRTFRVFEHEGGIVFAIFHKRECLLVVLLCLAAESCYNVGGESAVGYNAAYCFNAVDIPLACIFAVHGLEHGVAAALYGQMNALAHIGLFSNDMQGLVTHILGV
jgi:hypothetical protein